MSHLWDKLTGSVEKISDHTNTNVKYIVCSTEKKKAIHIWSNMGVNMTVFSFWGLNLIIAIINRKKSGTSCQECCRPLCLTTPKNPCSKFSPWRAYHFPNPHSRANGAAHS